MTTTGVFLANWWRHVGNMAMCWRRCGDRVVTWSKGYIRRAKPVPLSLLIMSQADQQVGFPLLGAAAVLLVRRRRLLRQQQREQQRQRHQRTCWVRPWLLRRPEFENLLQELNREDTQSFRNFMRIPPELFRELIERLGPRIQANDTNYRKALTPGLKIAVTLRYMATGDSYKSLQYGFRVAHNTISLIVLETCSAIVDEFMHENIPCPSSPAEWKEVADTFARKWNFFNCLGALDGKHVSIRCPRNSGSWYFNYKGYYSIVLMALVDANYKFLYIDVGATGSCSDGGTFQDCGFYRALNEDKLGLPADDPLPNDTEPMPYSIVADDAFALRTWLMKPYPNRKLTHGSRIFNYRLSRARRVVENAFGILSNRFRCLLTTMQQDPNNVLRIAMACCVLHNLLLNRFPNLPTGMVDAENPLTHEVCPGTWRDEEALTGLQQLRGNTGSKAAKHQRNYFRSYYNCPIGKVAWQDDVI